MSKPPPQRQGSLPRWTALAESASVAPSQSESAASSQDMRDELESSPPPDNGIRKRKPSGSKAASGNAAQKKPRLDKEPQRRDRQSQADSDDDPPASAHSKPTRRPSGTKAFAKARGGMPSGSAPVPPSKKGKESLAGRFGDMDVARKTARSAPRILTKQSTSTKKKSPQAGPSQTIDLTIISSDEEEDRPPVQSKPAKRIVSVLRQSVKVEGAGKQDNPFVLPDSDDDKDAAGQDSQTDRHSAAAIDPRFPSTVDEQELPEQDFADVDMSFGMSERVPSPPQAYIPPPEEPMVMEQDEPTRTDSPTVNTIVPALGEMNISPSKEHEKPTSSTPSFPVGLDSAKSSRATPDRNTFTRWSSRDGSTSQLTSRSSSTGKPQERRQGSFSRPTNLRDDLQPLNTSQNTSATSVGGQTRPFQLSASSNPTTVPSPTPSSPQLATPSRRARVVESLYNGAGGFFQGVRNKRRESSSSISSPLKSPIPQASTIPQPPVLREQSASATASPVDYASSGVGDVPVSSADVSTSSSVEPTQVYERASLPPMKSSEGVSSDSIADKAAASTDDFLDVKRAGSIASAIALAELAHAKQSGEIIDLTLDSDDDSQPQEGSSPDTLDRLAASTRIIEDLNPEVFQNDAAPAAEPVPVPDAAIQVRSLDSLRALRQSLPKMIERKPSPIASPAPVEGRGRSDSFPVSRRSSLGLHNSDEQDRGEGPSHESHQAGFSSDEDVPLAVVRTRTSSRDNSQPSSDGMAVDDPPAHAPVLLPRRGRLGRRRVTPASEDTDENDASEIVGMLEPRSTSPEQVPSRQLRPRHRMLTSGQTTRSSSAVSLAGLTRTSLSRRRQPTRSRPTDEKLVDTMSNIRIYSDDSDEDCITWSRNGRAIAKEYAYEERRARYLNFNLQDRMIALPLLIRKADKMQTLVFSSEISIASSVDEPRAPEIYIVNDVDDQLSPSFEFHYTNKIYLGEGVPQPDVDNLEGCDCIGKCNPNSTTCACVRRQTEWMKEAVSLEGFAYDKDGRIRTEAHDFPIFECNASCRCDDEDCQNRVIQKGRKVPIDIRKTRNKGWGIFARERIPANTFVGVYAGELLTDEEGHQRGLIYDKFGRTYLFDVDFYHLKKHNMEEWKVKYCIDAFHAGNFTRYLNHSCAPNCDIVPCYINEADIEKPLLTIFTCKNVNAGEELCFSYAGRLDEGDFKPISAKQKNKLEAVHALCKCGAKKCLGRLWNIEDSDSEESDG